MNFEQWMRSVFARHTPAVQQPSPAERRAERRLLKQRAFQESKLPDEIGRYTRQRARGEARQFEKELRTLRKTDAMQNKRPGGAAAVN